MSEVQMPMTQHPAYDDRADLIRSALGRDGHLWHIQLPRNSPPAWATYGDPDPAPVSAGPRTHLLTVQKAWGPAPYVGDPFAYMWKVATDELGRSVAGESWIEPMPTDPRYG